MKRYSIDLAAGVPVPVVLGGRYFLIDNAPSPVQVEFFGANGVKREEELSAAQSADWAAPEEGFASMRFTSAALQTVSFYVSRGRTGSNRGAYDVTDRAARLLGIVYGNLGQLAQVAIGGVNALQITNRGLAYGARFTSTAALASGATEQVFSAASNANGAIIARVVSYELQTAGGFNNSQCWLHAHTGAPAAITDGDVLMGAMENAMGENGASTRMFSSGKLDQPLFIAAGKGVWFRNNGPAAQTTAARSVLYTLI